MMATVDLKNAVKNNSVTASSRETIFKQRYDMLNDNYRTQALKRLREVSPTADRLGLDKQLDLTNNVMKTIVNKISRVYSSGIEREFADEAMETLYQANRLGKYMKQANKYVNAFNDVLLQVSWDYERNKPRLIFRYPHKTEVTLDDMGEPFEVEYFISIESENQEKWAYWSATEHYYKIKDSDGSFQIVALEGNEEMVNPYGVLPFIFMQNGFRDNTFWDTYSGNDMVEVTLDMAVYRTMLNHTQKWQSFKQMYITGTNVGAINGQILDPSQALTIEGDDTSIGLLDLQADIKTLSESIDARSTNVAMNYNIAPSQFRMSGQVASGFALQMENAALDEYTRDQQADFLDYEKELYNLLVIIGNENGNSFSEGAEYNVKFNDITYSESPQDRVATQEKRIALGLTNPIEIIQTEKDIDTETAEADYAENIKYRNMGNEQFNAVEPTVSLPIE